MLGKAINMEKNNMSLEKPLEDCDCGETLPKMSGAMLDIYNKILGNSWIKQEELAFGASLALMSVMTSRKVVFQGLSPNLYILGVSPSGSGKNAPLQFIKRTLIDINAENLLGSGNYVSEASLMNSLEVQPTRIDIMDEMGGMLKTMTSSKADYAGKMDDVLAELYTSSNDKYLGRATAEGKKGSCYRPNVVIYGATTPTGFSEAVSMKAIEKGLLGRFLIFKGDSQKRAERLRSFPTLSLKTLSILKYWHSFRPEDHVKKEGASLGGIPQNYIEIDANEKAHVLLDGIFKEFDEMRVNTTHTDPRLPIISRLYQQSVKLMILSACSKTINGIPTITEEDVLFGYKTILFYFDTMSNIVDRYIFGNQQERENVKIINLIRDNHGIITKTELSRATRGLSKRQRDSIIDDLIDSEVIIRDIQNKGGRNHVVYYLVEEVE